MKKFSKITAVILTVLLLCGLIVPFGAWASSASDVESREALNVSGAAHNRYTDFESTDASGKHYIVPAFVWSNPGNMAVSYVEGDDGNTYIRYYQAKGNVTETTSKTNKELWVPIASYDMAYQRNGTANIGAHDYVVVDFEIGTDSYTYKDSNGLWHTVDSIDDIPAAYRPAEGEEYRALALVSGMQITINGRGAVSLIAGPGSAEHNFAGNLYIVQDAATGKWYASTKSTYGSADAKYIELSNEVGKFDHFSYAIKVQRDADAEKRTTGYRFNSSQIYAFVNGQYMSVSTLGGGHDSLSPQAIRCFVPNDQDKSALCFDNVAINWYGYRAINSVTVDGATSYAYSTVDTLYSSEGYGIDDYISSADYASKPLYSCEDVVYNENYISPNGYISVDGNKKSINAETVLDSIKNNSVIETTFDILGYELPSGVERLTVYTIGGAKFSLGAESAKEFLTVKNTNGSYTVRRATEDDYITLEWVYVDGDDEIPLAVTKNFSFGSMPTVDIPATKDFDFDKLQYFEREYLGWEFDVDGNKDDFGAGYSEEVNIYDPEPIRALTAMEVALIREELGGVLTIRATQKEDTITDFSMSEFIIGTYDSEGLFFPAKDTKGGYDQYLSMDNFKVELAAAVSGSYVLLAYDVDTKYEIGGDNGGFTIGANKTINVDLNGRTLVQSYNATDVTANEMFVVEEGATLNLYSSKPGAAIYQAKYNSTSSTYVTASGIIKVRSVDEATVNVGDVYDEKGNKIIESADDIAFYGGTFISVGDATNAAGLDARQETIDDGKIININIDGGSYYQGLRSAMFVVKCPDVYININNATLINANGNTTSAGIFRDEQNDANRGNYYEAISHVNADNCVILSMKDGATTRGNLYVKMSSSSTAYFEDCTVVARYTNVKAANTIVGPGCTFAGNFSESRVTIAEGVTNVANTNSLELTLKVSYPKIFDTAASETLITDSQGKYVLNSKLFTADGWRIDYERSDVINIATYSSETVADCLETIKWVSPNGSVIALQGAFVGDTIEAYTLTESSDWYNIKSYEWYDSATSTPLTGTYTVAEGGAEFVVNADIEADVSAYVNMSYWSDFGINLHLPVENGITILNSDAVDNTVVYGSDTMQVYTIRRNPQNIESTADFEITVQFSVDKFNKTLTQTFVLNEIDYAVKVANNYDCGSPEMKLIAAYVDYKYEASKYINNGTLGSETEALFDEFYSLLATHAECTCGTAIDNVDDLFSDEEVAINKDSYSELSGSNVLGVTFALDVINPSLSIYVAKDAEYTVSVEYSALVVGGKINVVLDSVEDVYGDGIECLRYDLYPIAAENINSVFEITVVSGDDTYVGSYCLAEYIDNQPDISVAKYFYNYANACKDYYAALRESHENVTDYGPVIGD